MKATNKMCIVLLILFTAFLILVKKSEEFRTMPGFIHKVIVERELNKWRTIPRDANTQNRCLQLFKSRQISNDRVCHINVWLRYARKNGYDVVVFPYQPTAYTKDQYIEKSTIMHFLVNVQHV